MLFEAGAEKWDCLLRKTVSWSLAAAIQDPDALKRNEHETKILVPSQIKEQMKGIIVLLELQNPVQSLMHSQK